MDRGLTFGYEQNGKQGEAKSLANANEAAMAENAGQSQ